MLKKKDFQKIDLIKSALMEKYKNVNVIFADNFADIIFNRKAESGNYRYSLEKIVYENSKKPLLYIKAEYDGHPCLKEKEKVYLDNIIELKKLLKIKIHQGDMHVWFGNVVKKNSGYTLLSKTDGTLVLSKNIDIIVANSCENINTEDGSEITFVKIKNDNEIKETTTKIKILEARKPSEYFDFYNIAKLLLTSNIGNR